MTNSLNMICTIMELRIFGDMQRRLLQNKRIGEEWITPRDDKMDFNHLSSQVVTVIERYAASAQERDNVGCFLVFQETREHPKKTR